MKKNKLIILPTLAIAAFLVACGPDKKSTSDAGIESGAGAGTEAKTTGGGSDETIKQYWIPKTVVHPAPEGGAYYCYNNTVDENGYLIESIFSARKDFTGVVVTNADEIATLACDGTDPHYIKSTTVYSNDYKKYNSVAESSYSETVLCHQADLDENNLPTLQYLHQGSGYSCSSEYDPIMSITKTFYNGVFLEYSDTYGLAGADTLWVTDDDIITTRFVSTVSDDKRFRRAVLFSSPGMDGVWGSSDDTGSNAVETRYSDKLTPLDEYQYTAGPDNVTGTADDIVVSYKVYTYSSETGKMLTEVLYLTPGIDEDWETTEDNPINYIATY